jgi:hypothetical protein
MRLLTWTAGAALLAMSSAVAASTGPATTAETAEFTAERMLPAANEAANLSIPADRSDETPLVRTAGRFHP